MFKVWNLKRVGVSSGAVNKENPYSQPKIPKTRHVFNF
jgi:hypothetical protein